MFDHLQRVAAQSSEDLRALPRPSDDGDLSRGPRDAGAVPAGLLRGQTRARRLLAGCAAELADVTAASNRVDAALHHNEERWPHSAS